MKKDSTRKDWESYWGGKKVADEIYSNENRVAGNLLISGVKQGDSVLEVGAGTGRDSLPLAEVGVRVFQVDYSFESLRLIRQGLQQTGVYPVGGDTFTLPFRDGVFDAVFHQGLLEHFKMREASLMIQEQIRVLKPGGLLLIDVPQRYHIYTIMKHILIRMDKWFAGWERSFSFPELKNFIITQGLTPVHAYGEWMVPCLFYRVLREIMKKCGFRLPLYPPEIPGLGRMRRMLRKELLKTVLPLYTGISIGIAGRKKF